MLKITRRAAPVAARIRGVGGREQIRGKVHLYHTYGGTIIVAELYRISQDIEEDTDGKFGCGIRDSSGGTVSYVVLPSFLYRNGVGWNSCYAGNLFPEEMPGKEIVFWESRGNIIAAGRFAQ